MTLFRARLAPAFVVLVVTSLAFAADQKPSQHYLRHEGIDGSLILCGDSIPDAARDRFVDLAGKTADVVILVGADKPMVERAEQFAKALMDKEAKVVLFRSNPRDGKLMEALRTAKGVWLMSADNVVGTDIEKELVALLKRNGVVGTLASQLPLLPGAVVNNGFAGDEGKKKLLAALEKKPAHFGVGIPDGSALVVRGRQMTVLGNGTVTALLAKSSTLPSRTIEITAKTPTDLTLLRRCAIARAEAPFPPKEVPVPEVANGSLLIVGGGGMPADVTKRFIELAGGPDALIVVMPTANPDPLPLGGANDGAFFKRAGAKNVIAIAGRSLAAVEDPKTLELVKKAGGVWFGGGRQWRFVDCYANTKMEAAFHEVLKRGGVIGGSSAGATIQAYYLSRGSPFNNTEMMCEGYERGLGFLPGVAIDQHFAQRKRFDDMTALMKVHPQLLGIGLDEATAIVVRGHVAEVMGNSQVHFYDRKKPIEKDKPDHESLKVGGRYDLKERKILAAEEK